MYVLQPEVLGRLLIKFPSHLASHPFPHLTGTRLSYKSPTLNRGGEEARCVQSMKIDHRKAINIIDKD